METQTNKALPHNVSSESFEINWNSVPRSEFKNFQKKLKEIPNTYICHKMVEGGGLVQYDASDENGKVWAVRLLTMPEKIIFSATLK
jgi:hypothetical protein